VLVELLAIVGGRAEHGEAALADGALVDEVPEGLHLVEGLDLGHGADLELADALAGEVHDGADLFEGGAAAVRDVEGAALDHVLDLDVGEIELDRAGASLYVEVEVVLTRDVRAGAGAVRALGAGAGLGVVRLGEEDAAHLELALGHALDADGAGAHRALAAGTALFAGDRLVGEGEGALGGAGGQGPLVALRRGAAGLGLAVVQLHHAHCAPPKPRTCVAAATDQPSTPGWLAWVPR
jgi:hypothetical protein